MTIGKAGIALFAILAASQAYAQAIIPGGGGGGSGVSSFNSRTGAVTPASNDYGILLSSGVPVSNTAGLTLPTLPTGTTFAAIGSSGFAGRIASFGYNIPGMFTAAYYGTSAVTNGQNIGSHNFGGFNGTNEITGTAAMIGVAGEAYTTTANGTGLRFDTTPVGTTTLQTGSVVINPAGVLQAPFGATTSSLIAGNATATRVGDLVAIGSTGSLSIYNTTDQVTNTQSMRCYWSTATIHICGVFGTGTGPYTSIFYLGSAANSASPTTLTSAVAISPYTATTVISFIGSNGGTNLMGTSGWTTSGASGTQTLLNGAWTVNQSGTAGFNGYLCNPTETATGSGTKTCFRGQIAGVDKFLVSDTGVVSLAQVIGLGSTPTIAAGTGAGTSPTVSVTGTNMAGVVNVTTGTTPTASGIIATITFNGTLPTAPQSCQLTARNSATGLAAAAYYATAPTTTTWTITDTTTALTASTAYQWSYWCGG